MAFNERSLDDYVDVAQRIADFRALYPTGSLQPADPARPWEQAVVNGYSKDGKAFAATMIVYVAAAYRTPDDPRPGIGVAWEPFPGRTPYTLGSELMNAETSAWGRAIIAVLASDSKTGVASRQEVRNRRAEREDGLPVNRDGSLSRSRTTDEEKAAAGVMTAGQLAEHTALQPKRAEQTGRVTRIGPKPCKDCGSIGPHHITCPQRGSDPWTDQPAGALPVPAEDKPGTIDPKDQRAIMAKFDGMPEKGGMKLSRDQRLAMVSAIVGRPIASTNELSFQEGRRVRDKLKGAVT